MAQKHSTELKLAVVRYAKKSNESCRDISKKFGVSCRQIYHWMTIFQHQGTSGLTRYKTKRHFSMAFKIKLVNQVLSGETQYKVSLKNGLSTSSILNKWLRNYRLYGIHGLYSKPWKNGQKAKKKMKKSLEKENKALKRENELLRTEIAYYKMLNPLLINDEKTTNRKKSKLSNG